jgi:hypothetical protein
MPADLLRALFGNVTVPSEGGGGLGGGPPRLARSADRHGPQHQLASQNQAASRESQAARFKRIFNFRGRFAINPVKNEVNTEIKIMRISATNASARSNRR